MSVCSYSNLHLFVIYSFLVSRNTIHSLEGVHTHIVKYSKVYISFKIYFDKGFLVKFYDNDVTLRESSADSQASKLLIQNCIKAAFKCCTEHSEIFKFSQALTKRKTEAITQDS